MNISELYQRPCDKITREAIIGGLLLKYPFLTRETIGESLCSRPVDLLTIGNRSRCVLFAAAFHGMEWITSLIMLKFLDTLCSAVKDSEMLCGISPAALLNRRGLAVIPCVNPDGVEIQIHGSEAAGKYRTLVEKACSGDTVCKAPGALAEARSVVEIMLRLAIAKHHVAEAPGLVGHVNRHYCGSVIAEHHRGTGSICNGITIDWSTIGSPCPDLSCNCHNYVCFTLLAILVRPWSVEFL